MTTHYAVIGSPVARSLSPAMHKAAFKALAIDATYEAIETDDSDLESTVARLRQDFGGANVTAPLKTSVMRHLDHVDDIASRVGAVNTIVRDGVKLVGTNTDVEGFLRAMRDENVAVADANIVIIGAGGAARAVLFALLAAKARRVVVAGRRMQMARELVRDALEFRGKAEVVATTIDESRLRAEVADADVLVHATSASSAEATSLAGLVGLETSRESLVAVDLAYGRNVPFLAYARALGRRSVDGRAMLLHQGAIAFERWTHKVAPLEEMRRALDTALSE